MIKTFKDEQFYTGLSTDKHILSIMNHLLKIGNRIDSVKKNFVATESDSCDSLPKVTNSILLFIV
jgi:hypothetical protein